jgi:hypothetical protein
MYTYNILIRTPEGKVFEGVVSFTAVRRVGICATASIFSAEMTPEKVPRQYPPWTSGRKEVYCAQCRTVTTQSIAVDRNSEIVARCLCGRFLKFPLTETQEELDALLEAHQKANQ